MRIKIKHKGSLKKYGFKMNESESKQLKALKKAERVRKNHGWGFDGRSPRTRRRTYKRKR